MIPHHPRPPEPRPPGPTPSPEPQRPFPGNAAPERAATLGATLLRAGPPVGPDPVLDRLLDERIVHLAGDLDDEAAERVIARLQLLGALDPRREITLYVGTRRGTATAGLAVYDTLRTVGPVVATRAFGLVGPVGHLLLAAGEPGLRYALPHARIRLGHPAAGEPALRAGLGDQLRAEVAELLARHTGRPLPAVEADLAAERWLSAAEAVEYGLVDGVVVIPPVSAPAPAGTRPE